MNSSSDARKNMLQEANHAFDQGDLKFGLELLREHNKTGLANAESWHRQAVVEEQVGAWQAAGLAHLQSLKHAPNVALGYLYAGNWLHSNQNHEAAAAAYSVVLDLQSELLNITSGPMAKRSTQANLLLRSQLSDMHRHHCGKEHGARRIERAIWVRTHDQAEEIPSHSSTQYAPQLFYVPSLKQQTFYSSSEFGWSESLLANSASIQKELDSYLTLQNGAQTLRPYLDGNYADLGELQPLAGSQNWSALDIFRGGELNEQVVQYFPKTLELIQLLPTYQLNQHPYEVFFSVLKAGQGIAPHFGESNHALTVHLPLVVPGKGWLQVNQEKREWRTGELIAFDDSFLHSAHNQSDEDRIVLIFSIWHPDLTKQECEAIRTSFKIRETWYAQRGALLEKALAPDSN